MSGLRDGHVVWLGVVHEGVGVLEIHESCFVCCTVAPPATSATTRNSRWSPGGTTRCIELQTKRLVETQRSRRNERLRSQLWCPHPVQWINTRDDKALHAGVAERGLTVKHDLLRTTIRSSARSVRVGQTVLRQILLKVGAQHMPGVGLRGMDRWLSWVVHLHGLFTCSLSFSDRPFKPQRFELRYLAWTETMARPRKFFTSCHELFVPIGLALGIDPSSETWVLFRVQRPRNPRVTKLGHKRFQQLEVVRPS